MAAITDYPVPALEKGLDILEALAAAGAPQSLAELAAGLRRSSSELFRMLNCLERRGYVTRDAASARYDLSLKLFALAQTHTPTARLLDAARGPMRALTERFRESCHLSVLERGQLIVVAQQESPEQVRLSIEVGGRFDPVRTASGRLLLAHLPVAARHAWLADAVMPTGLKTALARIQRDGVSVAESETVQGVRDVAVFVGNAASGVMAALAVTRLLHRGERPEDAALIKGLRSAARAINSALGLTS